MPRPPGKKKRGDVSPQKDKSVLPPLDPARTGMPAPESITEVKEYRKKGHVFRIIKTTEQDAYDQPKPPPPKRKRKH